MTMEELNRTNIQALWRHMPGQPYNWPRKATVVGDNPKQVSPLDVPEGWVAPQLRRLVRPFAEAVSGAPNVGNELATIDGLLFELVKAEDLQAVRFPNTFHCSNCGRFTTINAHSNVPKCPQHGAMRQFTWAEMHECGHLAPLKPPRCDNRCGGSMALLNTPTLQTNRWFWRCMKCGTRSRTPVVRGCSTCRTGRVRVDRIPRSEAYYPQTITVLNPPTRNEYTQLAHKQVHTAAVAQALGVLKPGINGLKQIGRASPDDVVEQFKATMLALGVQPGDPIYDAGLAKAQARAGAAPAWRDDVDALGLDEETLETLGEECRQLSLACAEQLTAVQLLDMAKGTPLEPVYADYPALFSRHGLAQVSLLRQLPIAYVVAGYTRNSSKAVTMTRSGQPVASHFRFFTGSKSGKMRMYGVRTETEGLLFRLDPVKVVDWLVRSGLVDDPGVTDPVSAQRWLFQVTTPVTDIFKPPENKISAAVLGLTHSFAHRAMKALAARCGLNVDSLAEFLFPSNVAFLLYANTRSQFVLGGLEHVYRYDLPDALTELAMESRCMFDPPCRTSFGGSCAACLHVSEVACARFNTVLDRNLLFGTLPPLAGAPTPSDRPVRPDGKTVSWQPYWTV
ncbi:MAG TPA: hypothetical protein VJT49_14995 [Amycolatopsis sp.]|uniref:hypothetical protein n=1 Tax=Amycolatopsis sp. TaxID=37632 RepID=UPI002B463E84|nr:hypothetical protein [Amycolatopsis sp.]HKS46386.1 hypothetical protein [Amycolatopsis sp.]